MSRTAAPDIISAIDAAIQERQPRSAGREIRFLCPVHPDHQPSARWNPKKRTWFCDVCGKGGGWRDLAERLGVAVPQSARLQDRISCAYEYFDEEGSLLFQVVRLRDPKDFRQRRPDGSGGWIWNLTGVRRVLYRLPELLAADPTEYVFVPEGEKDVDLLIALDLVATTNPGGAGKWKDAYSEFLRGRVVVVIADNDDPGIAHADAVAASLLRVGCRVKRLTLPGPRAGDDVSDWLHADGTKEGLLEIVEALDEQPGAGDPSSLVLGAIDDRKSAADRLVELAVSSEATFFHDQRGDPHVAFASKGHRQIWPLGSRSARLWLSHLAWTAERKATSGETLNAALGALGAIARFEGDEHWLDVRVARRGEAIWYDLGDWRAVRIDSTGWEVVSQPPIVFRHFMHQKPQVEPRRGGDLRQFLRVVNVRNAGQQQLLLAYLVVGLVPDIPRPVIVAHGEHGSGKSTALGFVRELLDPSLVLRQTAPDSVREFVQTASHNLCLFLDNASHIPDWLSDAFCRLCTGDGFSKRQLYSDDDDVIYALRGLGGINGINLVATRPDLLDRCLIFSFDAIADAERRLDEECQAEFEALRPSLMGAMFDALSVGIRTVESVELGSMPRMADFARWGCAVAPAVGVDPMDLLDGLSVNVREQNASAIENSAVAQAVLQLMAHHAEWDDTPAATLNALAGIAEELHIDTRAKTWPKSPSALTRRLNEVRPNLLREGIAVQQRRTGSSRTVTFHPAENAVTAVIESGDAVICDDDAVTFAGGGHDAVTPRYLELDSRTAEGDGSDGNDGTLAAIGGDRDAGARWMQEVE